MRVKNDDWLRLWSRSAESMLARLVMLLGAMVRMMSRPMALRFARLIGDFLHRGLQLRRHLVYENLSRTFPEKSPEEIERIATGVYRNVAMTFIDIFRFPLLRTREDLLAIADADPGVYMETTEGGSKGVVMLSAHYGNWELMAMAFNLMIKPMGMIVKELSNKPLNDALNEIRTSQGNSIIYDDVALREGLRVLGEGGAIAILGDQSDPSGRNIGEFLGRKASIFQGAAFFALKAKVPMILGMCRHGENGRYVIDLQEIKTSDLTYCKEDIAILTDRYTRVFEEYIRKWPEEWFWLHNRWKNVD